MYTILSNFVSYLDYFSMACREVRQLEYQRYDNLFEKKGFTNLEDLPPYLGWCRNELSSYHTKIWVSRITGLPIDYTDVHHYGGIFKYEKGDYLRAHVDAGIHPYNGQRKVATALLYFTEAQLDECNGQLCSTPNPLVNNRVHMYLQPNQCVIFNNHDQAWHAVPTVTTDTPRYVMTVSYMVPKGFEHAYYENPRTRALFARTTWDNDFDPELANKRSSEQDHEKVWRQD